ncbi:D-glycero-beta-D-manno-heptose 1,7-bisphosphate 7-phosphatase [Thalassotalea ponticola]|uniref:D-glycero-beta-D-manno-heptose 1,7-bisphosphate 7-phosphatase n=1 Tax=Thalassotalea ponticola TaxID=1523392 RepID=UPI0025B5A43A|nr:D-glycero-beta-D-manno-heptose 1,7-bisphosphate 7-phosphatase [Thalassotalea ponticola]MDN3653271.1 D-glycero-beta-D-manno-heptose 1,7-bisphosphate 7-phosphatase [Thalassotalea ponticola]
MSKALFLDRDGIINIDHGYVYKSEDFEFVDGIFELCAKANKLDYHIYVITNQSGIGRGMYSEEQFLQLSDWMISQFKQRGVSIEQVYYCPHHPQKGVADYKQHCQCRKPEPGMILQAAKEHHIDLSASIFIGDKLSDMQAANRAGVGKKVLVSSRYQQQDVSEQETDILNIESVRSFIAQL